ncbi:MAG: glutamate--cysteine ligase [Rubrivivax sp. SCN 70-15]|nr:MAG: glutamate--cysteine ligase [Rubrivivax sp. SCN 70-15]
MTARLRALSPQRLRGMRRGIEKESLRADAAGRLALTPHPATLGSALTHPRITTDFSESQLEFITGVHDSAEACVAEMRDIHRFVVPEIGDELLWVASMPCRLPIDETIPLGRYGSSNVGRMKSVYRMGLGYRYGRRMQTISGIHYNWSLPGLGDDDYFALIRNFRRHSFLLLLLFGASPAVCSNFVEGRPHELQTIGDDSLYLPYATSLRMGRLGYQSEAQASIAASFNNLESYGRSLEQALMQPYPPYAAIGVRNPGGEYNQLSTSLLQIENEFYGTIRPKRTIRPGERPLHALRERGVEYIEVRCMDLDPFEPIGIGAETMRFLDVFLLHALLADSAPDSPAEIAALARNQHRTAAQGRMPGLKLERDGGEVLLIDWAHEIVAGCAALARQLDEALGGRAYQAAVDAAGARLRDLDSTPSARALRAMSADFGGSFPAFARACSAATRERFLAEPLAAAGRERFIAMAAESVAAQRAIEAADRLPFEDYRLEYLSVERLQVERAAA